MYFVIIVLFIATGIILHSLWRRPPIQPPKANVLQPMLKPSDRPGTGWYNEWFMEKPLNQEWKINRKVNLNTPFLGSLRTY